MKPTYGRVSRYGLIAFASSLDQIGPFARTVEDASLLLEVISGHDPHDSTSLDLPVEQFSQHLNDDIKGKKIGVISDLMTDAVSDDVKNAILKAIDIYKNLGAEIVEISLPKLKYSIGIYYILATAECSSNLARFDGVRYGHRTTNPENLIDLYCKSRSEGFGDEVKRRIMLGTYALSSGYYDAYYKKAQQMRRLVADEFNTAFEKVDALISPTCPNTAFDLGARTEDPLAMYLTDIATISANLVGIPAMSVPAGFDSDGMPIGLQILTPQLKEASLFNFGYKFEQQNDFYKQIAPDICCGASK
jgi:aspartyl-tRNA(Asn)/glutamyl-tRNA(Gln) amidotransferase subunit A